MALKNCFRSSCKNSGFSGAFEKISNHQSNEVISCCISLQSPACNSKMSYESFRKQYNYKTISIRCFLIYFQPEKDFPVVCFRDYEKTGSHWNGRERNISFWFRMLAAWPKGEHSLKSFLADSSEWMFLFCEIESTGSNQVENIGMWRPGEHRFLGQQMDFILRALDSGQISNCSMHTGDKRAKVIEKRLKSILHSQLN